MSVRLVTAFKGYDEQGEPIKNVSSTDDATLYAALVGPDDYVFDRGQRLIGTMEDANTLVVADGDGLINGHHFIVDGTLSFTIPTGTQGMQVSNLACLRYTKDAKGIQDVAPVVLTGEPSAESPQDPAYNEGDALDGVSTADFPIYRVVTTGISAGEPEPLFEVVGSLSSPRGVMECLAGESQTVDKDPNLQGNGVYVMRSGAMVTLIVRGGSVWGPYVQPNGKTTIFTLPNEYRPAKTFGSTWISPGAAIYGTVTVYHDGKIELQMSSGSRTNYYQFAATYVASDSVA